MTLMPHLLHIADPSEWEAAKAVGTYERSTRGRALADVGFIHMSFVWQVERVANFVYAEEEGPLLLLRIDPHQLDAPLHVETLDDYPERFPHLYGPLPVAAVVDVRRLERVGGAFQLPDEWRPSEPRRV